MLHINYAASLVQLDHYEEAKSLLRKHMPVARRVHGAGHNYTLRVRTLYAVALYMDSGATLDDLREAVNMLEDVERTARRVLGGAHPGVGTIEISLRDARRALCARETPSPAGNAGVIQHEN